MKEVERILSGNRSDIRDPARIDRIVEKLRQAWHQHPDQRLGQLVCNLTRIAGDPFPVEDTITERSLDALLDGGWGAIVDRA